MTDTLNYLAMLACLALGFIVGSFKEPDVRTKIVTEKKPVLIYVEKKLVTGQHIWVHDVEVCECEKGEEK